MENKRIDKNYTADKPTIKDVDSSRKTRFYHLIIDKMK